MLAFMTIFFVFGCSRAVFFQSEIKGQVLYLNNIPNQLTLKSNSKNLRLEITNAEIRKVSDSIYIIETNDPKSSILKIASQKTEKNIRLKKIQPEVELTFRAISYYDKKTIQKSEAQKITSSSWTIKDFPYDISGKTIKYKVIRIDRQNNSSNYEKKANENSLRFFSIAEVGDKYIFYNIEAETNYGLLKGKNLILEIVE